ncbi:MAG: hypothetical protein SOY65_10360 [Marinifilaceae bacterium]|nr:hypothetical protein [Marinifilaceae bacterium]
MKITVLRALLMLLLLACSEDKELGNIPDLELDYVLPQGGSPADDRIVEYYNKYGSYILYKFTERDFEWTQIANSTLSGTYIYSAADPNYVGNMLDLLEEIWFGFYPDDFLRKTIPYKVFLTATLDWMAFGFPISRYSRSGENQIAIGYCSDTLTKFSSTTKLEFKIWLQRELWLGWLNTGLIQIPDAFYLVSDYGSAASVDDPSSPNYARARGFVADGYGYEWCTFTDWTTGKLRMTDDSAAFIGGMVTRTSEEWAADLEFPLVKEKYDILRNYIQDAYGFDIQSIGNALYN